MRLHLGHLSPTTLETSIRGLFAADNVPVRIEIVRNKSTGRSRGFAFLDMENEAAADQAIATLDGAVLDGRALRVSKALLPKSRFDGYRREQRVAAAPRTTS